MGISNWYSPKRFVAILLFGICTQLASSVSAAIISGYDPVIHERYFNGAPNPSFIIDESDISGISGNPSGHDGNQGSLADRAQLISPLHVVTARHLGKPTVRFRTSDGTFKTYSVSDSFVDLTTDLGGGMTAVSDIRIYRLSEPVPIADGVTPIPIFDGDPLSLVGQQIYSMGKFGQAGFNVVRDVILLESGGTIPTTTEVTTFTYDTDPNDPLFDGVGVGETQLVDGDSGRATLLQIGDDVALLGPNLAIDPAGQLYGGLYTNFASLLTPYLPEIRSIVEADGYSISTLSFVPEPNSFALLTIAGVGWFGRRPRRTVAA